MSQTIKDITIPKGLIKKKSLSLYKAFIFKENGDKMSVNCDYDIFGLTPEDAFQYLLNTIKTEDVNTLIGKTVSFVVFTMKMSDLENEPLIQTGEFYNKDNNFSLTLDKKVYTMNLLDKIIEELEVETNDKNEIKVIQKITLV